MYSTQAHRAEVGRTIAVPRRPRRRRSSRSSTTSMPANGSPSSGVWRLATNGATPHATRGWMARSWREKATSSSMSASVSPGRPTIM
jgi:hypothetical protein